ncbi:MAG: response regulator [Longimicrobiales bacterium]
MSVLGAAPEPLKNARVLVVDDEPANVRVLLKLLRWAGYTDVMGVTDAREAAATFADFLPDLLLLDLHMPHMDGFEVMDILRPLHRAEEYFPILVLTGDLDDEVRTQALAGGAKDFLTKPFEEMEVLLRIHNLLETRRLHVRLQDQNRKLEERVMERTRALYDAQTEILFRLALAAEYRDDVTGQHAERVGILSAMIAVEMGMDEDHVSLIRRAAPLHDVGKIGIPDAILMKPGDLTDEEFDLIRSHVDIGARMLSGGSFELLRMAEVIARYHHERWDGKGYKGLVGQEIPLVGRIVTVADVYDVITSDRPYKRALSQLEAVRRIRRDEGSHFDPAVVAAFMRVVDAGRLEDLRRFAPPSHLVEVGAGEEARVGFAWG